MLQVENLTIHVNKDNRTLIENLSFVLNENDKYAVIGLEGSGKSTLLKAIYDKNLISYCDVSGRIIKKGKIGYLPQSIIEDWYDENVFEFLLKAKPGKEIDINDYQKLAYLDKYLMNFNLDPQIIDENKKLNQYSGGELIKLGLIKVLLNEPDVILLDEPTNDLDLETIIFLEQFILNETRPILFVSHDEALLENVSNGIIHLMQVQKRMKPKHEVKKLNYAEYKEMRKIALDSQEMIARKQRADYKKKIEKFRRIYQKVEHQQNKVVRDPIMGRLLKKKMHNLKSLEKRFKKEKEAFIEIPEREEAIDLFFDQDISIPKNKMILDLELDELRISDRILANNIKFIVRGNKKIAIIGQNGCGKSTLLKIIYEKLKTRQDLSVGYMSQNYDELIKSKQNALEFILTKDEEEAKIRKMMGALQFTRDEMLNKTKALSGGQKAKLLLLKMVVNKNNVLLLDEPTRNLSPLSAPVIHELLINYHGCVICVTHDRKFLEAVFDEIYELTINGLNKLT